MKRFLALFVLALLLNGCDDGKMDVESFDFSGKNPTVCTISNQNLFLYETNEKEALILQIDQVKNFVNAVTPPGVPIIVPITGSTKVIYRSYDNSISGSSLCATIPASSPKVMEEWNAVGGQIEIVTNAVYDNNETTGESLITGFSHNITFRDIKFDTGHGEQINKQIVYGAYKTATDVVAIKSESTVSINSCTTNNLLFKFTGAQALTLNLDAATYASLFANEVTLPNQPKTALVNATNKINYRFFDNNLSVNYFCTVPAPTTPVLKELWDAKPGIANASGIIEVTTTTSGSTFVHSIHLRNVTYKSTTSQLEFNLGSDYILGNVITQ